MLIGPAEADGAGVAQRRQRTIGAEGNQTGQVAVNPFETRGGRQSGIDGDDSLKRRFQRVNGADFLQQLCLLLRINRQANRPVEAYRRLAAAVFRLLLNKQMAVVPERHLQRALADVLRDLNGIQRRVLRLFAHRRQFENPRRQQAAAAQRCFEGL